MHCPSRPPKERIESMQLMFTVPDGEVHGLARGSKALQHRSNRRAITSWAAQGSVSAQGYEDKTQQAFRNSGIRVHQN